MVGFSGGNFCALCIPAVVGTFAGDCAFFHAVLCERVVGTRRGDNRQEADRSMSSSALSIYT